MDLTGDTIELLDLSLTWISTAHISQGQLVGKLLVVPAQLHRYLLCRQTLVNS